MLKIVEYLFYLLLVIAPFSQIIGGNSILKPIYVLGILILFSSITILLLRRKTFTKNFLYHFLGVFFLFNYAFIIGGAKNYVTYVGLVGSLILVFLLFPFFNTTKKIRKLAIIYASSVAICYFCILTLSFFFPSFNTLIYDFSSRGGRLIGTFSNPNMFAGSIILALPILFYVFFHGSKKYTLITVIAIIALTVSIFLAQSRSAIGGLFLGSVIIGLFLSRNRSLINKFKYGGTLVLIMFILIIIFVNLPNKMFGVKLERLSVSKEKTTTLYDISAKSVEDQRFYIYKAALVTVIEHPFGLGFSENQIETIYNVSGIRKPPHNFILKQFLNYGFIGGVYIVFLWFYPIIIGIWCLAKGKFGNGSITPYLIIGLLGYLIHSQLHSMNNWIYLWIYWGITLKSIYLETNK